MNTLKLLDLNTYELLSPNEDVRLTIEILPGDYAYEAYGVVDGKQTAFSEYGFTDRETLLNSLRNRELTFFYGVDIPEVMERNEERDFKDVLK